jgi:predicted Fe-Mo cluster-binding NifX family protein
MANDPIKFIASVEDGEIKNIQVIAEKLREKGCKINHVLSFTGVITGETSGKEDSLQEMKVKGIKHIEEDGEVRAC